MSLGADQRLAIPGQDVYTVNSSIILGNGVSIGVISINIVNDNLAELDEIFLVNIAGVELVNPSSTNNASVSPRLGQYLTSEVVIKANDGPHGILVFSPSR